MLKSLSEDFWKYKIDEILTEIAKQGPESDNWNLEYYNKAEIYLLSGHKNSDSKMTV